MKVRRLPLVVEAVQWTRENRVETLGLLKSAVATGYVLSFEFGQDTLEIATLQGRLLVGPGDWLVRGIKGEVYPVSKDAFVAGYEAAE